MPRRLAIIASHPIQYHAPLFRALSSRFDLTVFFAHRATPKDQADAGFGVRFDWDIDLLSGYDHAFLSNVAVKPGLDSFTGCDTPEIAERLTAGGFNAVLIQGWHLKAFLQAGIAAKRQGLPLLVRGDSHLNTPRSPLKRAGKAFAYPVLLRLFDAALYVGKRSYDYWRHYGYSANRLFFSPHCIDSEWFGARATVAARRQLRDELGIHPDTFVALFAGKLVPFKRPLDLVAAVAKAKASNSNMAVVVAGDGPLKNEIEAFGKSLDVAVHAMGFCNQSRMSAVYAAGDVLVLPSDGHETWGLVANEALACGRPVILADTVGAAPDLAVDGSAGWTYPVGDVQALADRLTAVHARPPSSDAILGKSALYSIEAATNGIYSAVEFVANDSQGRKL